MRIGMMVVAMIVPVTMPLAVLMTVGVTMGMAVRMGMPVIMGMIMTIGGMMMVVAVLPLSVIVPLPVTVRVVVAMGVRMIVVVVVTMFTMLRVRRVARRRGRLCPAGTGAGGVAEAAVGGRADALDMVVVALLGRADLGLEPQHLRAILAHRAVHRGRAVQDLRHPLGVRCPTLPGCLDVQQDQLVDVVGVENPHGVDRAADVGRIIKSDRLDDPPLGQKQRRDHANMRHRSATW